jgi:choline-sulfatase
MVHGPSYEHYVLISLDTLRSDGIAANPYKLWPQKYHVDDILRTPLLDHLASTGAFFPNCISAAPYTSASHASIFTGKWPPQHGLYEFFNRRLRSPTIFSWARQLGLRTHFKSDFPIILGPQLGFTSDIDNYIVEDDERYLALLNPAEPGVSFIHFGGLHIPYGFHNLAYGGEPYRARVAELEAVLDDPSRPLSDQLVETYRSAEDLDLLLRYKRIVQHYFASEDYDFIFQLYLEGITHFMRHRFEPFMERLIAKLAGRRVLFVIFGDHGEDWDRTCYGHFNSTAEGVVRVPVIFFGNDVSAGTHPTRIRSVDIAPTIASCLTPRLRPELDGTTLAGTVFGGETYPGREAFSQAYVSDRRQLLRVQEKLLRGDGEIGSLPHVCYDEAAYDGDFKLRRQSYEYTASSVGEGALRKCEPKISLELIDPSLLLEPVPDAPVLPSLLAQLDRYGAAVTAQPDQPEPDAPAVTDELRAQLQNMGYAI